MTFPINLRLSPRFLLLLISNSLSRKFRTTHTLSTRVHMERNDTITMLKARVPPHFRRISKSLLIHNHARSKLCHASVTSQSCFGSVSMTE